MNWRAIGCLGAVLLVFVGLGVLGLSLASGRAGCPAELVWQDQRWDPDRPATGSPALGPADAPAVAIGTILVGLSSRTVYGPAGTSPSASGPVEPPLQVSVDCGDGSFQTYRGTPNRGTPPSPR